MSEWGWQKSRRDERGAIGMVLRKRLHDQCGFELEYELARDWEEYAERE